MKTFLFVWSFFLFISCQSIEGIGVLVPPTVDQDPDLPSLSIKVAGRQRLVHRRTFGNSSKPKLFILHGTYSDLRSMTQLAEELSSHYFVVVWDQRGCGLSERITEEEFSLDYAVEEVQALKAIFAPSEKITILGHSWGGGLGTLYTGTYPESVQQLILIEPIPLKDTDMQEIYQNLVEFTYSNPSWNQLARHGHAISPNSHAQLDYRAGMILKSDMTASYHCDKNNIANFPIHRVGAFVEYLRNRELGSLDGFKYKFHYSFVEKIKVFKDPILVLGGSCSSLGYDFQVKYSKPHFHNVIMVEVKNSGHRMHIEKFEEVVQELKSYLKEY